MKRICVLIFAILLLAVLPLTGCRSDSPEESASDEIANPIKEYDSVSKLNEALGFDMAELNPDLGFTPVRFETIDGNIGQIEYEDALTAALEQSLQAQDQEGVQSGESNENAVAEKHITLRMMQGDEDISGIYGVDYDVEDFNGIDVNIGVYQNYVYVYWWTYEDYCYSVAAYNVEGAAADAVIESLVASLLGLNEEENAG